ncbi:hypothetical protein ABZ917_45255 [Nonomuraea wenchangensis]
MAHPNLTTAAGLAALCLLTGCAGYTPTPLPGTAALDATVVPQPTGTPAPPESDTGTVQTKWGPLSELDRDLVRKVRDVAGKLRITLPVKPTDQQQAWMTDISGRSGPAYDATYVKWLRLAHGQIFGVIGTVRGTTQNTLIRRFSEQANAAVLNHQRLLESTGLTTPESFPTPPS